MEKMKKYNFLKNVNKHIEEMEENNKKQLLGEVIGSLQQPMKNVLNSIVVKQVNDLNNLLNSIKKQPKET